MSWLVGHPGDLGIVAASKADDDELIQVGLRHAAGLHRP